MDDLWTKTVCWIGKSDFVCFTRDFTKFYLDYYSADMNFMSFVMDMGTGDVPRMSVFNESKGYIAYDIPDNVRGMEILTIGVTTDMQ